ncbi:MAG: hypothetical protein NTV56_12905 [Alphaproteobacteria bacterium]|nr:hypothetical protein [Alphaproteobacteria bacterium]
MSELQPADPKAPACPMCAQAMGLKTIHRQQPSDHFIFKCGRCELEYPVAGKK